MLWVMAIVFSSKGTAFHTCSLEFAQKVLYKWQQGCAELGYLLPLPSTSNKDAFGSVGGEKEQMGVLCLFAVFLP